MKVRLEQDLTAGDMEVLIKYARMDQTVRRLEDMIKAFEKTVKCSLNDTEVLLSASGIYYAESVDKRTFVYGERDVYRSDKRLYQLLEELSDSGFVQVSKSCILNIHVLESVRPLRNSRMEAALSNGERVCVTRKYVSAIKENRPPPGPLILTGWWKCWIYSHCLTSFRLSCPAARSSGWPSPGR